MLSCVWTSGRQQRTEMMRPLLVCGVDTVLGETANVHINKRRECGVRQWHEDRVR